ncbi:DNA repair exonuclease [Lacticaseibacillus pantheris DSM 15945 = JCM 12539 = NBRC 106106]|uniref:Nuclease SbcCD subunit D n=1 Tax=Lacticaseibacillus pantheris DSM 15945 = JCM 12539 = NBRC 106106 TaxID=1423783 RepID=A0A0R1U5L5_9LACO|nr:exonuclease SbcCD subunit D [Lacticaseibacillus pantheris]KRL88036.1 DNA repair exonuclease [Lacticaseibacillus pantheris DSM 15945 = JCM 12539 = NBRC 106106]
MRILHTADWHIGRTLSGFDLLPTQQASFAALRQVAHDQNVDAIIIAGDLYDRGLAAENAVNAVNGMMRTLNRDDGFPLLVISGNHDSAPRLATGSEWYSSTGFYLHTRLEEAFTPVTIGDTQFFLLPYFEPAMARNYFDDDQLTNIGTAMVPVIAKMVAAFAPDKKHVLVAHFFAAGSTHTGSETPVNVGGLDAVPLDVLEPFDYVALGHLHNRHAVNADKIQYAGSLVKFDVSETEQRKGVYVLDTETMQRQFVEIPQSPDFINVQGSFEHVMDPDFYHTIDTDSFAQVTLTDTEIIPDLMSQLRTVYQRCTGVDRTHGVATLVTEKPVDRHLDPMDLLGQFYDDTNGVTMTDEQRQWAADALAHVEGQE